MDLTVFIPTLVIGLVQLSLIVLFVVEALKDRKEDLDAFIWDNIAITVFLCIIVVLVLVNSFSIKTESFYIIGYTTHQKCEFYEAIEDSKFLHESFKACKTDNSEVTRIKLKMRVHDEDEVREVLDKLDFPVFSSYNDAMAYLCEQKEGYTLTFDGECMRCD